MDCDFVQHVQSTGAHKIEGPTRAELIFLITSIVCTVIAL